MARPRRLHHHEVLDRNARLHRPEIVDRSGGQDLQEPREAGRTATKVGACVTHILANGAANA
jgi:hypothetical protein